MLSQSTIKSFETCGCPRKFQAEMKGELTRYTSEPMMNGSYFEYLGLGGGSGKSADVTDLPRLKSGKKSMDQLRIEAQAEKFLRMFDPNSSEYVGWTINNKQIHLSKDRIEGTLDFDMVSDDGYQLFPSDLKLTADLDSEWGYWSNPEEMDHLQPAAYTWLYSENIIPVNKFHYWVFDYSPKMNVAHIEVNVSDEAIVNMKKRFSEVETTMMEYDLLEEWPRIPSPNECRYCRLNCPVKINKAGYIHKVISI